MSMRTVHAKLWAPWLCLRSNMQSSGQGWARVRVVGNRSEIKLCLPPGLTNNPLVPVSSRQPWADFQAEKHALVFSKEIWPIWPVTPVALQCCVQPEKNIWPWGNRKPETCMILFPLCWIISPVIVFIKQSRLNSWNDQLALIATWNHVPYSEMNSCHPG